MGTTSVLMGVLATAAVLVVLSPLWRPVRRELSPSGHEATPDRLHELLEQLRDLDEDLRLGRVPTEEHARLRASLEREAGSLGPAPRGVPSRAPVAGKVVPQPGPSGSRRPTRHRLRWAAIALAVAVGLAGLGGTLSGALSTRRPGETITGNAPKAAGPSPLSGTSRVPAAMGAMPGLSAVEAAAARVRRSPKDIGAHLALAAAYSRLGESKLAAVEYLAVTRLDRTNPEANTALALIAFAAHQVPEAMRMVDTALSGKRPYPDALYARGIIELTALNRPGAAGRDLRAYLAAAPHGTHRTAAETLLAISGESGRR